jgi:hypothetical protein
MKGGQIVFCNLHMHMHAAFFPSFSVAVFGHQISECFCFIRHSFCMCDCHCAVYLDTRFGHPNLLLRVVWFVKF